MCEPVWRMLREAETDIRRRKDCDLLFQARLAIAEEEVTRLKAIIAEAARLAEK